MSEKTKKWLYEFDHESTIDGKIIKKSFSILKPGRQMKEDGDIFYSSEVSRFAKAGVLPKAAWGTILSNSGGTISDSDREDYGRLLIEFRNKSLEVQRFLTKGIGALSPEEKREFDDLSVELEGIRSEVQAFEAEQVNIFENTAEYKARNRAILWWTFNLAYQKNEDGSFSSVIPADSFNKKLEYYDELEEGSSNQYILEVMSRMVYFVTLWFLGRASKPEDFNLYDKEISQNLPVDNISSVENTETKKTSEVEDADEDSFIPEKISE